MGRLTYGCSGPSPATLESAGLAKTVGYALWRMSAQLSPQPWSADSGHGCEAAVRGHLPAPDHETVIPCGPVREFKLLAQAPVSLEDAVQGVWTELGIDGAVSDERKRLPYICRQGGLQVAVRPRRPAAEQIAVAVLPHGVKRVAHFDGGPRLRRRRPDVGLRCHVISCDDVGAEVIEEPSPVTCSGAYLNQRR